MSGKQVLPLHDDDLDHGHERTQPTNRTKYVAIALVVAVIIMFLVVVKPHGKEKKQASAECVHQSLATDYRGPYIVTVASSDRFQELQVLVSSIQRADKRVRIAVFDTGLTRPQHDAAASWHNVAIFAFGADRYPLHVSSLDNGAAALLTVKEAAKILGSVLYVDTSMIVQRLDRYRDLLDEHGSVFVAASEDAPCNGDASVNVAEVTARKLGVSDIERLNSRPMLDMRVIGVNVDSPAFWTVLVPAAQCALDRACISAISCGGHAAITSRVHLKNVHYEEELTGIIASSTSRSPLLPTRRCSAQPWPLPAREI